MSGDFQKDNSFGYASPACSLNEVDPEYVGLQKSPDAVAEWRKEIRRRLIGARSSLGSADRDGKTSLIRKHLDRLLPDVANKSISFTGHFSVSPICAGG